ncbi:MAG: stage II sporulation protein M [bacterium]|nr:stage II sporulation protein M [bacterium]
MMTRSERFVKERRIQWMELRKILLTIRKSSHRKLTERDIEDFPRLYRMACADLAQARTLRLSPDVLEYLNNIVGQAHNYLYSFQPVRRSMIKGFFTHLVPSSVTQNISYVLLSALFFFLPYLLTFLLCQADPDNASLLVPEQLLTQMEESYKSELFTGRGVGMSAFALSFYIQHNITIAFLSFACGIFAGLGTIYFLVYNGMVLGAISGYITALGYGDNFSSFVTAHSVLELSGLVVAGAAGLLLGFSIIKGSAFSRKKQLAMERDNIFYLISAACLMLACAAAIEGGISPQPLPYFFKLVVALGSAACLFFYFFYYPLKRRKEEKKLFPLPPVVKGGAGE